MQGSNRVNLVSDDLQKFSNRRVVEAWSFNSDARAATYEVTLWDNGQISCTCAGWVFARKTNLEKFGHKRWCKHLGEVWSAAELSYLTFTGGKAATAKPPGVPLPPPDPFVRSRRPVTPAPPPVADDEEEVRFAEKDDKGRKVLARTENISLRPTRSFDI